MTIQLQTRKQAGQNGKRVQEKRRKIRIRQTSKEKRKRKREKRKLRKRLKKRKRNGKSKRNRRVKQNRKTKILRSSLSKRANKTTETVHKLSSQFKARMPMYHKLNLDIPQCKWTSNIM
jgi:hypothetical protein